MSLHDLVSIPDRLAALRRLMQEEGIDACLIPSADPHLSEYLPERWQGRQWLSGFTGSAGTLIVTLAFAGVWTDSRYWEQAEAELKDSGVALMKLVAGGMQAHIDWLAQHVPAGGTVVVDGAVLSLGTAAALQKAFTAKRITLRTDLDPLDAIWPNRPALPQAAVYEHKAPYAPVARRDKLARVREAMVEQGADWHFLSSLDDIAWLLNLRGADVSYNPVFLAHVLIGTDQAQLFVGTGKVPAELEDLLKADGVTLAPYEEAAAALAALPDNAALLVDPARVTFGLAEAAPASIKRIEAINPSTLFKSCKTVEEVQHICEAMAQDGAALCEFFARFEAALAAGERVTELTVDEWLTEARTRRPNFVSLSFSTIAGYNAGGALPHYHATEAAHSVIEGDGLLLIDSGGQYLGGTTDITRVVPIGTPNAEQKRDYTRVLKGMIALSRARFPEGIAAQMLDAIARAPIWEAGIDYGHGTGHGVGYFLNVHEGPQSISFYGQPTPHSAMRDGMITSNEPGIYRPGQWGVRIENLLLCVAEPKTDFGHFMRFETLTLCPIDTRCIDRSLMREDEIAWLNAYHAEVHDRISPLVDGAAREWLESRTQPL
ncbi:Xaa-Pro aminopeptidase [Pseudomonas duriflava]|uniref:Xaa-Pro aminopeptidase n=1 Tax=Pseudomonas duriflava TaxID=459528 RepID=A0A562QMD6_9PSED|nr:aminopeptidase P family protein [Pseudomonas duriflava]TWI57360.1 Xaa-Pro aminopeptidase [Pseudomonas duriflava]